MIGLIPLLIASSVFGDHGYDGLISLISFASRKADVTELNFFSSFSFYFVRLILLTFPAFVFLLPRLQFFRKIKGSLHSNALQVELNAVTVLFPLIYIIALSFMGAKHYHYLLPLVPPLALNIARIDLLSTKSKFKFEACFAGVMFVLYLLAACALCFQRDDFLAPSFYAGFVALILSSILCFYAFSFRLFSRRKVSSVTLVLSFHWHNI